MATDTSGTAPPGSDPASRPGRAPVAEPFLAAGDERRRLALCTGERCPHCGSGETRPWGGFSGRRRFRCRACARTFSTFTGTAARYLKRLDAWPAFLDAVDDRASIRRSADRMGVHPSTAFRWRHRLLADWRRRDRTVVAGRVRLDVLWLAHSEKGRRPEGRPPRKWAYRYPSRIPDRLRVTVALLHARDDATAAFVVPTGRVGTGWLDALMPAVPGVTELVTGLVLPPVLRRGKREPEVRVSRLQGSPVVARAGLDRRLAVWLRPLRGVATRYLPHYLQWFRSDLSRGPGPAATIPANRTRVCGPAEWVEGALLQKNAALEGGPI